MPRRRTNRGRRRKRRKTQTSHRLIQRLKRMHRKQPRRKKKMKKRRKKRLLTPHQSSTIQRALVRGWYKFGNTSSASLMEKVFTVLKSKSFRVKQISIVKCVRFYCLMESSVIIFSKSYNLFHLQLYYLTLNYIFFRYWGIKIIYTE